MDYKTIRSVMSQISDWETKSNSEIADIINATTETVYDPIQSDWLLEWAIINGVYQRWTMALADASISAEIKATLQGILLLIERDNTTLQLQKTPIQDMVSSFISAELLTQAEASGLYAKAAKVVPVIGFIVQPGDIQIARSLANG